MYIFGSTSNPDARLTTSDLSQIIADAQSKTIDLSSTPISAIIDILDRLSFAWKRGSSFWNRAFEITKSELSFSPEMIASSLDVIPEILSRKNLEARLKPDFQCLEVLDQFRPSDRFAGDVRAFPLGVLFHVSAGNVFLGAIDSLVMGFLTKNISIVKLSSRNLLFPILFAESLHEIDKNSVLRDKYSLLHFASGNKEFESMIKGQVNAIIAWGGEEMIQSYKRDLPMGVKFLEYGPKISFQVLKKDELESIGYEQAGKLIANDISMWDQAACSSPQNCFVEDGINVDLLLKAIANGFREFPYSRGRLTDDEQVEILKERARASYNKVMLNGNYISGEEYLIHFDPSPGLRPSPLNRTIILKSYSSLSNLISQLKPFSRYLQSCSILADSDATVEMSCQLGALGIMRVAPLGQVMQAPVGAPHDGKYTLQELTRLIPIENQFNLISHVNESIDHVPFYNNLRHGKKIRSLDEMPLLLSSEFSATSKEKIKFFCHNNYLGGYIFSSGGTSGNSKYCVYSKDEFTKVSNLLATGFKAQGMTSQSTVANIFVAGNLWSSFLAVDQAIGIIGATSLPIGGLADLDLILSYIESFRPDFIVGLPTQLLELARHASKRNIKLKIANVLYAGEHLSIVARKYIQEIFGTEYFGSAGYASVDAGPIGYQCKHCEPGVHHLFTDHVHLEIVKNEGVVTSFIKKQMPIIRLQTGDILEWLDPEDICPCGRTDVRFSLKGRSNSQINVWGCRLFIEDFEKAMSEMSLPGALIQIEITNDKLANEMIQVSVEHQQAAKISKDIYIEHLIQISRDLRTTHSKPWILERLKITPKKEGEIERVARTGKIKVLIDRRS